MAAEAPHATGGNAAAHLAQLALQVCIIWPPCPACCYGHEGTDTVVWPISCIVRDHWCALPLGGGVSIAVLLIPVDAMAVCDGPSVGKGSMLCSSCTAMLQAVAERTRRQQSDPRMASLRSVGDLQQLWVGSRANYKWGGRQPLRRRRGDVHGDISAVVLRLDWDGAARLVSPPRVTPVPPVPQS